MMVTKVQNAKKLNCDLSHNAIKIVHSLSIKSQVFNFLFKVRETEMTIFSDENM
jgi:hypothetical protein